LWKYLKIVQSKLQCSSLKASKYSSGTPTIYQNFNLLLPVLILIYLGFLCKVHGFLFHSSLSVIISSLTSISLISCITHSIHLSLGQPIFLLPSIFMFIILLVTCFLPLLIICPCQNILLSVLIFSTVCYILWYGKHGTVKVFI
jgi:hypothetical protein